ncbi:transcriptional repressor [Tilletia horrida]|nr:transcriptional repressor [Tilletia horrida]
MSNSSSSSSRKDRLLPSPNDPSPYLGSSSLRRGSASSGPTKRKLFESEAAPSLLDTQPKPTRRRNESNSASAVLSGEEDEDGDRTMRRAFGPSEHYRSTSTAYVNQPHKQQDGASPQVRTQPSTLSVSIPDAEGRRSKNYHSPSGSGSDPTSRSGSGPGSRSGSGEAGITSASGSGSGSAATDSYTTSTSGTVSSSLFEGVQRIGLNRHESETSTATTTSSSGLGSGSGAGKSADSGDKLEVPGGSRHTEHRKRGTLSRTNTTAAAEEAQVRWKNEWAVEHPGEAGDSYNEDDDEQPADVHGNWGQEDAAAQASSNKAGTGKGLPYPFRTFRSSDSATAPLKTLAEVAGAERYPPSEMSGQHHDQTHGPAHEWRRAVDGPNSASEGEDDDEHDGGHSQRQRVPDARKLKQSEIHPSHHHYRDSHAGLTGQKIIRHDPMKRTPEPMDEDDENRLSDQVEQEGYLEQDEMMHQHDSHRSQDTSPHSRVSSIREDSRHHDGYSSMDGNSHLAPPVRSSQASSAPSRASSRSTGVTSAARLPLPSISGASSSGNTYSKTLPNLACLDLSPPPHGASGGARFGFSRDPIDGVIADRESSVLNRHHRKSVGHVADFGLGPIHHAVGSTNRLDRNINHLHHPQSTTHSQAVSRRSSLGAAANSSHPRPFASHPASKRPPSIAGSDYRKHEVNPALYSSSSASVVGSGMHKHAIPQLPPIHSYPPENPEEPYSSRPSVNSKLPHKTSAPALRSGPPVLPRNRTIEVRTVQVPSPEFLPSGNINANLAQAIAAGTNSRVPMDGNHSFAAAGDVSLGGSTRYDVGASPSANTSPAGSIQQLYIGSTGPSQSHRFQAGMNPGQMYPSDQASYYNGAANSMDGSGSFAFVNPTLNNGQFAPQSSVMGDDRRLPTFDPAYQNGTDTGNMYGSFLPNPSGHMAKPLSQPYQVGSDYGTAAPGQSSNAYYHGAAVDPTAMTFDGFQHSAVSGPSSMIQVRCPPSGAHHDAVGDMAGPDLHPQQPYVEEGQLGAGLDAPPRTRAVPQKGPDGKKRYPCSYPGCDKTFSTSGHAARHSRIHTGQKPYRCTFPGCKARFSRQDNSLQHYRTHILAPKARPRNRRDSNGDTLMSPDQSHAELRSGVDPNFLEQDGRVQEEDEEMRAAHELNPDVLQGQKALAEGTAIAVVNDVLDSKGRKKGETLERTVGAGGKQCQGTSWTGERAGFGAVRETSEQAGSGEGGSSRSAENSDGASRSTSQGASAELNSSQVYKRQRSAAESSNPTSLQNSDGIRSNPESEVHLNMLGGEKAPRRDQGLQGMAQPNSPLAYQNGRLGGPDGYPSSQDHSVNFMNRPAGRGGPQSNPGLLDGPSSLRNEVQPNPRQPLVTSDGPTWITTASGNGYGKWPGSTGPPGLGTGPNPGARAGAPPTLLADGMMGPPETVPRPLAGASTQNPSLRGWLPGQNEQDRAWERERQENMALFALAGQEAARVENASMGGAVLDGNVAPSSWNSPHRRSNTVPNAAEARNAVPAPPLPANSNGTGLAARRPSASISGRTNGLLAPPPANVAGGLPTNLGPLSPTTSTASSALLSLSVLPGMGSNPPTGSGSLSGGNKGAAQAVQSAQNNGEASSASRSRRSSTNTKTTSHPIT